MTIRDVFEHCLIELNKVQAPPLLLADFIYLFNKAIQQYYNKRYTLFEFNQQLTDDLRVLQKTIKIFPTTAEGPVFGQSYDCPLPDDYVHILNCICEFVDHNPDKKCDGNESVFQQGANKLTSNQWPTVINNAYMRPSVKRPYYYIINLEDPEKGMIPDSQKNELVISGSEKRYGNATKPIMQIKCGNDPRYTLRCVYVEYLRAPEHLSLNQEQLDAYADTTQVLEFPDYVIYQIIDQLVAVVLENTSNPRIQTHTVVNTSIQDLASSSAQK